MRYIYGPVQSRRLGLSLGVSLTPYKICNFDCVYCQLGPTQEKAFGQKEYAKAEDVIGELRSWLQYNPEEAKRLNYITLSGMGEPTLNNKIGEVISRIRKITPAKIALITNSSLLREAGVRQAIMGVDLIVPSLDAADEAVFQDIDRPAQNIRVEDIIRGLINLRKEFRGAIWLEVMLVKGLNDSLDHIRKLKEATDLIKPDKIQLNSPVRTGAEAGIAPADKNKIAKIKEILGERCDVF
jgi:wyosine [tRNA(Phe)-imidazoG37] synthetase (radical SAM superfamily)